MTFGPHDSSLIREREMAVLQAKGGQVRIIETRRAAATSVAAALLVALSAGCSTVTYSEDFDREVQVTPAGTWAWQPLSNAEQRVLSQISPFLQRRIERAVGRELDERGFTLVSDGNSDYLVSAYTLLPDRTARAAAGVPRRSPVNVSVGIGVGYGRLYGLGRPYGFGHPYRYGRPYGFGRWAFGVWPAFGYWGPYAWGFGWARPVVGFPGYGWSPGFGFGVSSFGGFGWPAVIGSGDRGPGTLIIDVIDGASGNVVWQGLAKGALLDMPSGDELDAYVDQVVHRTLEGFPPGA